VASDHTNSFRVALCVSGGIAAYKAAEVLRGLQQAGCTVRVCMTARATEFVTSLTFRALSGAHVITNDYAPDNPDPIAHITFSQSVDLLLVAPATANIIAKFANGIADDFLTSTYLAANAPVAVAPAMNTTMWEHKATRRNIEQLRADGVYIIEPDAGEMACGTTGAGRLAEPARIVAAAMEILHNKRQATSTPLLCEQNLSGERILITAGGTREAIDPVRFISNRSSGRMGFALAEAAIARGALVTIIAGTTTASLPTNASIRTVHVTTAAEMHAAVMREIEHATIFVAAAAVADYRPTETVREKIKKTGATLTLMLEPTADILAEVAHKRRHTGLLVIGFAAESHDLVAHAQEKLTGKKLDLIVANDITQDGAGFDSDTNIVTLINSITHTPHALPMLSKRETAERILDEITLLRLAASTQSASAVDPSNASPYASDLSQPAQTKETFATKQQHTHTSQT